MSELRGGSPCRCSLSCIVLVPCIRSLVLFVNTGLELSREARNRLNCLLVRVIPSEVGAKGLGARETVARVLWASVLVLTEQQLDAKPWTGPAA